MSKKLVAFFSATGVTAALAKVLAQAAGADLYEIEPEVPYTRPDLDWKDKQARSTIEMHDLAFRPAMTDTDAHVAAYDVIFVGFPIWWYIAPTIVNTFLERYDFTGKTIVPFATSEGSGLGDTMAKLRPSASAAALWKDGTLLNPKSSQAELAAWVESLQLP